MGYLFCFVLAITCCTAYTIVPTELQCENKVNPIGVRLSPKLSWKLGPSEAVKFHRNLTQTGYQIEVISTRGDVLWSTGKVQSTKQHHISYEGNDLQSHQLYMWKVKVWDQNQDESPWSQQATFVTTLANASWSGMWITSPTGSSVTGNYLRKVFTTSPTKKVWSALVSVVGLGLYSLYLNGQKISDDVISNGFTLYNKLVLAATYDVTSNIITSSSISNYSFCLGVILGNGMYKVTQGYDRYTNIFKDDYGPRQLLLQLDIEYADGSVESIVSDLSWTGTQGPITFTSIYGGEDYNATLEDEGWAYPNFTNSWLPVVPSNSSVGTIQEFNIHPVQVMRTFQTQNITQITTSSFIYDFGQNFAGWPMLTVTGVAGAVVRMTPGETLLNGAVYQAETGSPMYFTYTLKGSSTGALETWHPQFSYYGFRYLLVNISGNATIKTIEGQFIHANLEIVGSFTSSNALFNRIHHIITISMLSNLQSIFHDCPHREKLGWLEQAHLLAKSVAYNFDVSLLFAKSITDMFDSQFITNGEIPTTSPAFFVSIQDPTYTNSPEWGSTYIILPYFLYNFYGNVQPMTQYYEPMWNFINYLTARSVNGILDYGLGDWCDIVYYPYVSTGGAPHNTPINYTGTLYYYQDIVVMAQVAAALGRTTDNATLTAMAAAVSNDIGNGFFDVNKMQYSTGSQTANAMAIALGLNGPNTTGALLDNIITDVRHQQNHTTCGDIGHVYLLRALASNNRSDVIFDIHTRTDIAGYGYMLTQGATSLAETWTYMISASHNHAMFGHIEEWFYEYLAGIQYTHGYIRIQPTPLADLTFVNATFNSPFGVIESSWNVHPTTKEFTHFVQIPVNTKATITIPCAVGGTVLESGVEVGEWEEKRVMRVSQRSSTAWDVEVGSGAYLFSSGPI